MLLASTCPGCGRAGVVPCAACRAALQPVGRLSPPPGLDALVAAFAYAETGKLLITALKYRNQRALVPWAAGALAASLALLDAEPTLLTWAPTGRARRRQRGFDQAQLLARAMSRATALPVRACLQRQGAEVQTGRSRVERLSGPLFRPSHELCGATVVVVDDVVTTGATLTGAAAALRRGGAAWVIGLCLAATPMPRSSRVGLTPKELISQPKVKNS